MGDTLIFKVFYNYSRRPQSNKMGSNPQQTCRDAGGRFLRGRKNPLASEAKKARKYGTNGGTTLNSDQQHRGGRKQMD